MLLMFAYYFLQAFIRAKRSLKLSSMQLPLLGNLSTDNTALRFNFARKTASASRHAPS